MEALTIETFKTDKITAISVDDKSSGEFNYKSVKFAYDGGEVPPICIDGDFRLFRFRNKNSDTYSLSITCNPTNESFFRELSKVIAKESFKILKDKSIKPEDFELIKDNRSDRSVYAKINSRKSGKVKCRISQGSYKNVIGVEELVDEKDLVYLGFSRHTLVLANQYAYQYKRYWLERLELVNLTSQMKVMKVMRRVMRNHKI